MIYFWRFLVVFGLLNLANIIIVDGGAGMEPVWCIIIATSFVLSFKKPLNYFFSKPFIKGLFTLGVSCFLLIEGLIVFHGLSLNVPQNSDYLIVLGARVRGEQLSLSLKHRLDVAYDYLSQNPDTKAILTGGQGPGEDISEAEAMHRYLVQKGITSDRLILEDQATDTVQNIRYSFEKIDPQLTDPKVMVVTNKFHILRSKLIAKELGHTVSGIGSRTLLYLIPTYYLRECFAVVAEILL